MPMSQEASNYDEDSLHQSMLFSDGLKDLKNLRTQLYTAAEYFELSYTADNKKKIVVETLKDYAMKALVNTVDHLGSVTYRVADFIDEKVDQLSETEFLVTCLEQRVRMCQKYMDHEGRSQQWVDIDTPKFHKRYILPDEMVSMSNLEKLKYFGSSIEDVDDWNQLRNAVRATMRETPPPTMGKAASQTPPQRQPPQRAATFSFTSTTPKNEQEKQWVSPHGFPLQRSESVAIRNSTSISRTTTPSKSRARTPPIRHPSGPRRSASVRVAFQREAHREREQQQPSKSKRLLKSLLSRRKTKKDHTLYTYLDEY